jgi:filamentous hemagglutinin family protein
MKLDFFQALGITIGSTIIFTGNCVLAQITPDATLPNNSQVRLQDNIRFIEGGTQAGGNLFHSFKEFSVPTNSTAHFNNATDVQNILTRVTGGSQSNIDGLIRANGITNLFLINPSGIIFGQNARLDIGGSFLGSTANSFKFGDGFEFSAKNPQAPPLLTINITPGLQYSNPQQGTISNAGNLVAKQDLTLVANKLDLQGQLQAGRDLKLQATDTVRVRDSIINPFLAQAGSNLTIMGNQGIDILALNHPTQTPFISGENLSLISDSTISGDARFMSGGSFFIGSVSGGLANFVSKYDPIISSNSNVNIAANYTGASLLVEAKGNIRLQGNINITRPDNTRGLPAGIDSETLGKSTALIVRSGQNTLVYGGINSGNLPSFSTITAPEGISIGGNVTLQPFNGAGGIVSLTTASGDISIRGIRTNGGAINIDSAGEITTNRQILNANNKDNNAGAISLTALGNITTGSILSQAFDGGNGGNITIKTNGDITFIPGTFIFSDGLLGGNIILNSNAAISITGTATIEQFKKSGVTERAELSNIRSRSSTNTDLKTNNPGTITITADSIFIKNSRIHNETVGNADTKPISLNARRLLMENSLISSETFGQGNVAPVKVNIESDMILKNSNIEGYNWSNGNVGSITINSQNIELENSGIGSRDQNASNGVGAVTVTTESILLSQSSIFSAGNKAGNAGVQINATTKSVVMNDAGINTDGRGGKGSPLSITAADSVLITNDTFIDSRGLGEGGGPITITANSVLVDKSLIRSGDSRQGGGSITIDAGNSIKIANDSLLTSQTFGGRESGKITLNADVISLANSKIISRTLDLANAGQTKIIANSRFLIDNSEILTTVNNEAVGNGGNIDITTGFFSAINSAALRSSTLGTGNAGNVIINASKDISFDSGSAVFSEVQQDARGNGGNINISTNNGSIFLNNNAQLSANTSGVGRAGDVTFTTQALTVENGAKVSATATQTASEGEAGRITVNANQVNLFGKNSGLFAETRSEVPGGKLVIQPNQGVQSLIVNLKDEAQMSTATFASGKGGTLTITAPESITLTGNGTIISAETTGNGAGGDLSLSTEKLMVENRAQVTVSSRNQGQAGNLTVNANSILMDSQGKIRADTTGAGGNINLNVKDLLLLRNRSEITTNARGIGILGGNITIDAKNGFLVASPFESNRISADSANFLGGNIKISVLDIFGFQLEAQRLDDNTITATGANEQLRGTVQINKPEDSSRGVVKLPINIVDAVALINQHFCARAYNSSFTITGRGGILPSPYDVFAGETTWEDWRINPIAQGSEEEQRVTEVMDEKKVTTKPQKEIVEAQGWVINKKGQVELVAATQNLTPHRLQSVPVECFINTAN